MAVKKIEPNSGLPELGLIENFGPKPDWLVHAGFAVMAQPFDFVLHQ